MVQTHCNTLLILESIILNLSQLRMTPQMLTYLVNLSLALKRCDFSSVQGRQLRVIMSFFQFGIDVSTKL